MHRSEKYHGQSRQAETIEPASGGRDSGIVAPPQKRERLLPLDALRGVIIILMALDHTSYYLARVHPEEFWGSPLPQYSNALAFLTRWLTHLAAPGFFFLMGTSMVLFAESRRHMGWPERKIVRYFAVRGLLLIVIQALVVNPAWLIVSPNLVTRLPGGGGEEFWLYHAGVLYGLGATMIAGAPLLKFGPAALTALSFSAILATQVLIPPPEKVAVLYSPLIRLLLIPGQTRKLQVYYPLIPWLGIVIPGIIFGRELLRDRKRAYGRALIFGLVFIILFVIVRCLNRGGDFHPADTSNWMAFLNVTKYPPSLVFILLTLGLNLILLFLLAQIGDGLAKWGAWLLTFGRTALFFYIVHLYLYGLMGFFIPGDASLPMVYPWCLAGLLMLYPVCRWYGNFKQKTSPTSVWRLF
ncbi:MAG: heparan-alpha-glucosaminide N-acetyltransferase domain-containing protein [bacterium]